MKNFILITITIFILSVSTMASAEEFSKEFEINSTSGTEIALDGTIPVGSYIVHSRDGSDWKWSSTNDFTDDYFTFLDGQGLEVTLNRERSLTTLFWAKSVSGTVILELLIKNNNY